MSLLLGLIAGGALSPDRDVLNRLTPAEIALLRRQDPAWTLPRCCDRAADRMAAALELELAEADVHKFRTAPGAGDDARENARLASIAALTGGELPVPNIPDADERPPADPLAGLPDVDLHEPGPRWLIDDRLSDSERSQLAIEPAAAAAVEPINPSKEKIVSEDPNPVVKRRGAKPRAVRCVENGKVYEGGCAEVAGDLGVAGSAVRASITGGYRCKSLHFEWADGATPSSPARRSAKPTETPRGKAEESRSAAPSAAPAVVVGVTWPHLFGVVVAALARGGVSITQDVTAEAMAWSQRHATLAALVGRLLTDPAATVARSEISDLDGTAS